MTIDASLLGYKESNTKRKNRSKILKSAFELVIQNGIHFVTVQEIVDYAEVTFRTFYNYYDHIYEIYVDLQILCWEEVKRTKLDLPEGLNGYERTILELKNFKDWLLRNQDISKYMVLFDYDFQTKYSIDKVRDYLESTVIWNVLVESVKLGVRDGSILEEDPVELAFTILQSTYAFIQKYLYYTEVKQIGYDQLHYGNVDLAFRLLENSIKKRN